MFDFILRALLETAKAELNISSTFHRSSAAHVHEYALNGFFSHHCDGLSPFLSPWITDRSLLSFVSEGMYYYYSSTDLTVVTLAELEIPCKHPWNKVGKRLTLPGTQ